MYSQGTSVCHAAGIYYHYALRFLVYLPFRVFDAGQKAERLAGWLAGWQIKQNIKMYLNWTLI
jgi:hypothetical protein